MTRYRIRVGGHLDEHWSAWFGGLTLTRGGDGTTSLVGAVADQAELHGLLLRVRDLGVTLISVELLGPAGRAGRGRRPRDDASRRTDPAQGASWAAPPLRTRAATDPLTPVARSPSDRRGGGTPCAPAPDHPIPPIP